MPLTTEELLQEIHAKVLRLEEHILGGSEPEQGIKIRVDRLDRELANAKKAVYRVLWIAVSAIVGAIGLTIWNKLTH